MPLSPLPDHIRVKSITIESDDTGSDAVKLTPATAATVSDVDAAVNGTVTYNVLNHGLLANGVTDNTPALLSLVSTVKTAGGGRIFFPAGDYFFGITYNGALSPANRSIYLRDQGALNIVFCGEGPKSRLIWGGNAGQGGGGGGAAHFFYLRGQTSHVTFENLKILQSDLTNPDPGAEQHHLIRVQADVTGNTQHITIRNCDFGLVKGDAINISGGFNTNAIKADVPGNQAQGALSGLTNTSPTGLLPGEGQRVCVEFSGTWNGGSFTFAGTEPNGRVISETIAKLNPGADSVAGYREFATITSVTMNTQGSAGTAQIGWAYASQYVDILNCRFNGFDRAGSAPGYGYRSAIGAQRLACYIRVVGCWMTGSDDQLIDFEPTGNGYLGPWTIERNTIIPLAVATNGGADTCCSFFGNANKFPCERSSISYNLLIGGGLIGGKLRGCDIVGNYLWVPEDARLVMQFTDRMEDVRILDNWIEAVATGVGDVTAPCISLIGGGSTTVPDAPDGVIIGRNTLHWACLADPNQQPAIRMTVGTNCAIRDNVLVNHGSASSVDVAAIKLENPAIAIKNVWVDGNTIEGGRGGGSIARGVDIATRPSTNWTNLVIKDNIGTGVVTTGVNLRDPNAGAYVTTPYVTGNQFPDATNAVVLGTGVIIRIGGNGGTNVGQYAGAATDPATDTDLDNVGIGSSFQSNGVGGDMYLKTAATAAGWKKVTHA